MDSSGEFVGHQPHIDRANQLKILVTGCGFKYQLQILIGIGFVIVAEKNCQS